MAEKILSETEVGRSMEVRGEDYLDMLAITGGAYRVTMYDDNAFSNFSWFKYLVLRHLISFSKK